MPLVLVKEDGTGKPDANSYASAADGDAYHDGHLYATSWTAATTQMKEAALVMATRLIDSMFCFHGYRAVSGQALQWPRLWARDPDKLASPVIGRFIVLSDYYDSTSVPKLLSDATIDTARELIKADRTADP